MLIANNFFTLKGRASLFWSNETKMWSQVKKHNRKKQIQMNILPFFIKKNRQSVTACSLLSLLLLSQLTALGPKMKLSNIYVKYFLGGGGGGVSKIGKHRIELGRVR